VTRDRWLLLARALLFVAVLCAAMVLAGYHAGP
jgi:hypothetical protein